ncbi:hypothetical protein EAF04_004084 [Stromatinia cepivora]|nr:hypothetical protein EAF04_004084 [Stromatinia cepivora]
MVGRILANEGHPYVMGLENGNTPLHFAVANRDEPMALTLLENGADMEVIDSEGCKTLYIAVNSGFQNMPKQLTYLEQTQILEAAYALNHYPPPGQRMILMWQTGLSYRKIKSPKISRSLEMVEDLLENGADVDARNPQGLTSLWKAVATKDVALIKLLLQYGPNIKLELGDTVRLLIPTAKESVMTGPKRISPPVKVSFKFYACNSFKATIIDLFEFGEQETFTSPIYELIYGSGISNMMNTADEAQMKNGKTKAQSKDPKFRWYHLSANNMEWVEHLVSRLIEEGSIDPNLLSTSLRDKLGLRNVGRQQYCSASAAESGFPSMRNMCQEFEVEMADPNSSTKNEPKVSRNVVAFGNDETRCLKKFYRSLGTRISSSSNLDFGIKPEIEVLLSIKNIRNELGILEALTMDQQAVLGDLDQIIARTVEAHPEHLGAVPSTGNAVIDGYKQRIEPMSKLAHRIYREVTDLLELKQKQQAVVADLRAVQAAKQGKTVMIFTVVTIVFLPLSFMAAFFAINMDRFPLDKNGKLPMNYVLKYMLTTSLAISLPLKFLPLIKIRYLDCLRNGRDLDLGNGHWSSSERDHVCGKKSLMARHLHAGLKMI